MWSNQPLGSCDPAGLMVLDVSVVAKKKNLVMDGIMPNPTLERRLGDFMENRQESSPQKSGQESNGTVYSTTRINILKFLNKKEKLKINLK